MDHDYAENHRLKGENIVVSHPTYEHEPGGLVHLNEKGSQEIMSS